MPFQRDSRRQVLRLVVPILSLTVLACTCTALGSPGQLLEGLLSEEVEQVVQGAQATLTQAAEQDEPRATETREPSDAGSGATASAGLLAGGSVDVPAIEANSDGEIQGPILTVQLTNPESNEVVVEVPCGLIFQPETADDEQRLMSIQPASASLAGGGTGQVEPYVICIDADRAAPSLGTTYEVGEMASGDLLKLAECLCQQDLEASAETDLGMGQMGVQFAVWAVSSGTSVEEMFGQGEEMEGALGDVLGEEGENFLGFMQELIVQPAQDWLDRCGIEVDEKAE